MDGYINTDPVNQEDYQKYLYIQELYLNQVRIDKEIESISSEIKLIPKIPQNIESWASSFSSKFKISDLNKVSKLNKKYNDLIEERKINGSKIKLFAIDNILVQIEQVNKNIYKSKNE